MDNCPCGYPSIMKAKAFPECAPSTKPSTLPLEGQNQVIGTPGVRGDWAQVFRISSLY